MCQVRVIEGPHEGLIGDMFDETEDRGLINFFGSIVQSFPKTSLEVIDVDSVQHRPLGPLSLRVLRDSQDDE